MNKTKCEDKIILILKSDYALRESDYEEIRKLIMEQLKEGVVMIPGHISYEVIRTERQIIVE